LNSVPPNSWYLFGNRAFADVIKLRWGHTRLGWLLNFLWLMSL
jgi:hypothetical protein